MGRPASAILQVQEKNSLRAQSMSARVPYGRRQRKMLAFSLFIKRVHHWHVVESARDKRLVALRADFHHGVVHGHQLNV